MTEENKAPISEFKEEQEKPKYTKGLIILTDDQGQGFEIIEKFSYGGVEIDPTPGLVPFLVKRVSDYIHSTEQAHALAKALSENEEFVTKIVTGILSARLKFKSNLGTQEFPLPDAIANLIVNSLMNIQQMAQVNNRIIRPS